MSDACGCKTQYTVEPRGEGYALYYDRCPHRHGYNLVNMVDPAWNFDPKHIERLINAGDEQYQRNPTHAYEAD